MRAPWSLSRTQIVPFRQRLRTALLTLPVVLVACWVVVFVLAKRPDPWGNLLGATIGYLAFSLLPPIQTWFRKRPADAPTK